MIFCFPIKSYDFWLINYLFGFNIKDNGIRYGFEVEFGDSINFEVLSLGVFGICILVG